MSVVSQNPEIAALIKAAVDEELIRLGFKAPEEDDQDYDDYDDYEDDSDTVDEDNYELTVVINSSNVVFASELGYMSFLQSHVNFEKATRYALELIDDSIISEDTWKVLENLHSTEKAIVEWANGRLSIEGNRVRFDGDLLPASLETHLLALYRSKDENSLQAWTNFTDKLREASHVDTHNRLHAFLQYNDLAINPEGNVLAWKVVSHDFLDKYSRTLDNSVGKEVVMPRTKVTHDPSKTCSHGLHACAFEYLRYFGSTGDQLILVEIDVRDIVSVPTDYNGKKVRCCKYKVISHVGTWGSDVGPDSDPLELLKKVL